MIDPKSPEPREKQIKRQITEFTRNRNVRLKGLVSMDEYKDLIAIEKDFGEIELGYAKPPAPPQAINLDDDNKNSHWKVLAGVLDYGPAKMKTFKALIDQSVIEMKTEHEQEKKRLLDAYLKKRIKGTSKQHF